MLAAKQLRQICKAALCSAVLLFALLFLSCSTQEFTPEENTFKSNGENPTDNNFGKVKFVNESSYRVSIRESAFTGPVLVDTLKSGETHEVNVRPSGYGFSTVFSIVYLPQVASGMEFSSGDVWTSGIDPNVQISQNIEAGQTYGIQIPQPPNLELTEAFLKIVNNSDNSIKLMRLNLAFGQAGNNIIAVPSGKTGVYRIDGINASTAEVNFSNYFINQVLDDHPMPVFTAKRGYVYTFEFNNENEEEPIRQIGEEQKLIF